MNRSYRSFQRLASYMAGVSAVGCCLDVNASNTARSGARDAQRRIHRWADKSAQGIQRIQRPDRKYAAVLHRRRHLFERVRLRAMMKYPLVYNAAVLAALLGLAISSLR